MCLRNKKAEEIMEAVPNTWYGINDGLPALNEEAKGRNHQWLVKDGAIIQQHIGDILKEEKNPLPFKIMFGTTAQSGSILPYKYNTSDDDPKKIDELVKNSLFATTTDYNNQIFE